MWPRLVLESLENDMAEANQFPKSTVLEHLKLGFKDRFSGVFEP